MSKVLSLSPAEQQTVDLFKEEMTKICGPQGWDLRIFGSRARREGYEDSDLDILVLVDILDEPTKVAIWDAAYYAFLATEILLSPLVLSRQQYDGLRKRERLIAMDIEREGISV